MASAVSHLREVVLPARHVQVAEVPAPRPAHQPRVLPPVAEAEAALSPPPGPSHAPQRAVEVAGVGVPVAVAAASLLQQMKLLLLISLGAFTNYVTHVQDFYRVGWFLALYSFLFTSVK